MNLYLRKNDSYNPGNNRNSVSIDNTISEGQKKLVIVVIKGNADEPNLSTILSDNYEQNSDFIAKAEKTFEFNHHIFIDQANEQIPLGTKYIGIGAYYGSQLLTHLDIPDSCYKN